MNTYPDSMVVKKFLNHLIQDNQIRPGETLAQSQLNRPAVWNYEMSVVLMGFERLWRTTHDEKYQDQPSGVWWQITNKASQEGNYLESSGTAMFVFALAKSIRMGYLSNSFLPAVMKAYNGMIKEFVEKDAKGGIHYTKAVSGAGLGGTPYRDGTYGYYVSEPKRDDDLKAIGPFIQACIEMATLNKK
jgi:rhamnogalacturonyl hydrolase YesR